MVLADVADNAGGARHRIRPLSCTIAGARCARRGLRFLLGSVAVRFCSRPARRVLALRIGGKCGRFRPAGRPGGNRSPTLPERKVRQRAGADGPRRLGQRRRYRPGAQRHPHPGVPSRRIHPIRHRPGRRAPDRGQIDSAFSRRFAPLAGEIVYVSAPGAIAPISRKFLSGLHPTLLAARRRPLRQRRLGLSHPPGEPPYPPFPGPKANRRRRRRRQPGRRQCRIGVARRWRQRD